MAGAVASAGVTLRLPGFSAAPIQFTREFWNTRRTLRLLWTFVVVAVLVSFTGARAARAHFAFGGPSTPRCSAALSRRCAPLRASARVPHSHGSSERGWLRLACARYGSLGRAPRAEGLCVASRHSASADARSHRPHAVLIVLCSQGRVRFRAEPQKAAFVISTVFTCLTGGRPPPPPATARTPRTASGTSARTRRSRAPRCKPRTPQR